ncbi:MAG: trypsin-like serine protease [Myxococcota bacterium]
MPISDADSSPRPRSRRPRVDRPSRRRASRPAIVSLLVTILLAAAPTPAVLIDGGDGTGNASAPIPDPGFGRVGVINGLSGVYVRNGWVLTASHVGAGKLTLGGTTYAPIAGSTVRFKNPDGSAADLIAFKLATKPPIDDIEIADAPMPLDALLTLVGYGRDRGAATTWMGIGGWSWASTRTLRWGTNRVSAVDALVLDTHAVQTTFDDLPGAAPGQFEADIVTGDSGGGAFTGSGNSARLVGILFARGSYVGQPAYTSLHGNTGLIVDLYAYRDDVLAVIDRPDCSDGLDDDGDGLADHPDDPGCASPTDASERSPLFVCDNELDDDGDGLADAPRDPGCANPADASERGAAQQCDNGLDDDGDLAVDFPDDSGCLHPTNPVEAPEPDLGALVATGALALAARDRRGSRRARQTSSTRSTR